MTKALLILAAWHVGGWITGYTYHRHLVTDPECIHHRAQMTVLEGWVFKAARGLQCVPCMARAALGDDDCFPFSSSGGER